MIKYIINISIISVIIVLLSCKKNSQTSSISNKDGSTSVDTLDISYYPNKKIKDILLSEYQKDKNVKLFYSESGALLKKTTNFNNYPQKNYEYENNQLVHEWMEGDIGGCIAITEKESFWNKKGTLIKEIHHTQHGNSCSEKILIHENKEFFENTKKIKSIKYTHESYEGSAECPCGIWKEFDQTGKIIAQQEFSDCKNNSLTCEETENQNILNKWVGNYHIDLQGKGDQEGEEYKISLNISKDSIIYSAEGYQLYQRFLLSAVEENSALTLKYKESLDGTNSWALKNTQDFGKIYLRNGKYIWESPFLNISFTNNQKMIYNLKDK